LKDLIPINKYNLYQITIYKNSRLKYVTFCTPECRKYIDQYLDYRKRAGETLTPDSPLLRKHRDLKDPFRINIVELLNTSTIRWILYDLLSHKTGMRIKNLNNKSLRHDTMMCHGLRKFFDTAVTNAGMHPLYSEKIMGHSLGLKHKYTKITSDETLEGNDKMIGYAGAINDLTINETYRLQKKVWELEEYKRNQKEMLRKLLLESSYQIKNETLAKRIKSLGESLG
jgi:hypothetical protein